MSNGQLNKKHKSVSYSKWGYIFIAPFFLVYTCCTLIPQFLTLYNSFFENFFDVSFMKYVGPNYVGFGNFTKLFSPDSKGVIQILKYFCNTMLMWVEGAIPQILIALLIAVLLSSYRLRIKGQGFFKAIIYMPNLIMASAFAMLIFALFSNVGPINAFIVANYGEAARFDFFGSQISARLLIALLNFLMWFGNTTILLLAGIMGIDQSLFESAKIDGASPWKVFSKVTLPLLKPIIIYVVITAMLGGLQMFDVPQVLSKGNGDPARTTMTVVMQINSYLGASKNYGMAGAVSTILFIVSGVLSGIVYRSMTSGKEK